jgi:hypothetical protein
MSFKATRVKLYTRGLLVEFILAETEKTFHVYGKLTQKQVESAMYWLPKTQVTDDPYFDDIKVAVDLMCIMMF